MVNYHIAGKFGSLPEYQPKRGDPLPAKLNLTLLMWAAKFNSTSYTVCHLH